MESNTPVMCGVFSDDNIMPLAGPADGGADPHATNTQPQPHLYGPDPRAADTEPQANLDGDDELLEKYGIEPFDLPNMTTEEFDRAIHEVLGRDYVPEEELEPTEEEELKREEDELERERNARQLEEDILHRRDEAERQTTESRMADRIEVEPMNWDGNAMRPRQATGTGPVACGASSTETVGPTEGDLALNDTGDTIVADPVEEDVITTNTGGAEDAGAPNATGGTTTVPSTGADVAPTNVCGTKPTTVTTTTEEMMDFYLMLAVRTQAKPRGTKRARSTEGPVSPSGTSGTKRRRVDTGDPANDTRGARNQAPRDLAPTKAARAGPTALSAGSAGHGARGGQSRRVCPPLPCYGNSGVRPPHNAPPPCNPGRDINTAGYRPSANSGVRPTGNAPSPHNPGRDIVRAGQRPRPAPIVGHQQFADIPISGPQQFARVPIAGPQQRAIGATGGTAPSGQGPINSAGPPGTLSLVPDGDMVWGYLSLERLSCIIQLPHGFEGVSPSGRAGVLWRGFFDTRGDGQWQHHDSTHMTMGQNLLFVAGGRVQGQVDCGEAGAMKFAATTVRGGTMGQGYSAGQMRRRWAVMAPKDN